ncbi:HD domain-containing protein [Rathayibacter festucae]|uniref:HD domain-containing protein n=1 Tax=Rathayibacter festucae TaxID=110937 RepID=UPI002A699AF3|nr:HD domain-containing protein [Rathayibacter festucae]MDY0914493.1 HD domain-containing protein [Rathayibacter festucae]
MAQTIAGITVPDTALAREAAELVREEAGAVLFDHSSRVFLFGALKGRARGLTVDLEQLYVAALFHDLGLTSRYRSSMQRFELDGADAARDFLLTHDRSDDVAQTAWLAIALHTTPEVPTRLAPEVALVTAGVETDVLGLQFEEITLSDREAVTDAHPRPRFKRDVLAAFNDGMKHRPDSTFGTMNDDVLAHFNPSFRRGNFVDVIQSSAWSE